MISALVVWLAFGALGAAGMWWLARVMARRGWGGEAACTFCEAWGVWSDTGGGVHCCDACAAVGVVCDDCGAFDVDALLGIAACDPWGALVPADFGYAGLHACEDCRYARGLALAPKLAAQRAQLVSWGVVD